MFVQFKAALINIFYINSELKYNVKTVARSDELAENGHSTLHLYGAF